MDYNGVFIIAEISANHNNDFDLTVKTIEAIAETGADAVKIQTYKPESLALDVENEYFGPKKTGTWKGIRPWDLYQKGAMPYEWQPELKEISERLGLTFFSSPFDLEAVDFLEEMGVELYKIASFEINDIPLIRKVAKLQKPMIISTGVATDSDISLAVKTCFDEGNRQVSLLQCTSEYPAKIESANLSNIADMRKRYGVNVGLSDHTMGSFVPIIAVTLGATIIEKHFILDRNNGGVDSSFSMEPAEFKAMVDDIRRIDKAIGTPNYEVSQDSLLKRRSLFAVRDISAGETVAAEAIRSLRPGHGLAPVYFDQIVDRKAKVEIKKGDPLSFDMFEE